MDDPLEVLEEIFCEVCGDGPTEAYDLNIWSCGHTVCEFCVKDGCPMCAMLFRFVLQNLAEDILMKSVRLE